MNPNWRSDDDAQELGCVLAVQFSHCGGTYVACSCSWPGTDRSADTKRAWLVKPHRTHPLGVLRSVLCCSDVQSIRPIPRRPRPHIIAVSDRCPGIDQHDLEPVPIGCEVNGRASDGPVSHGSNLWGHGGYQMRWLAWLRQPSIIARLGACADILTRGQTCPLLTPAGNDA